MFPGVEHITGLETEVNHPFLYYYLNLNLESWTFSSPYVYERLPLYPHCHWHNSGSLGETCFGKSAHTQFHSFSGLFP